jgi:SDR family mycofactocin-dependent oxidoreductase
VHKLDGKVAFITGSARGQGRSHAVRLAEEGADILAVDICRQLPNVPYPMATSEDLAQTVAEVEALGRRIVAVEVDVRDVAGLRAAISRASTELGGVDIVVANAGINTIGAPAEADQDELFRDVIDVNLVGVWNTVRSAAPRMIEQRRGGAIVLTSSTQGLTGRGGEGGASSAYSAAKHGVVGLMRSFSHWLAPHAIRVNSVHPTGVDTPMVMNEAMLRFAEANPKLVEDLSTNLLPPRMIESIDVSHAIAWLVSDEARFVTGITLPVDAGFTAR